MKYIVGMMIALSLGATIWFMTHLSQTPDISKTNSQPVISRQDILNATDLKAGIKQAVQNNNNDAIDEWLEKASDLAVEAGLDHEDIQYLQSELAARFVVFRAKRSLFNDAIEQAYYAIEDITVIKEQYPEAQDLFAKVDTLIKSRNDIIQQIAHELAADKPVDDNYLKAAQENWKARNQQAD